MRIGTAPHPPACHHSAGSATHRHHNEEQPWFAIFLLEPPPLNGSKKRAQGAQVLQRGEVQGQGRWQYVSRPGRRLCRPALDQGRPLVSAPSPTSTADLLWRALLAAGCSGATALLVRHGYTTMVQFESSYWLPPGQSRPPRTMCPCACRFPAPHTRGCTPATGCLACTCWFVQRAGSCRCCRMCAKQHRSHTATGAQRRSKTGRGIRAVDKCLTM